MMERHMLKIDKKNDNGSLVVALDGRLDTTTAPDFEKAITADRKPAMNVIVDMKKLAYISSAGLRVLLMIKRAIGSEGTLKVRNASSDIQDVMEITGFSSLMDK